MSSRYKKCNDCNKTLPFDSEFCQYCGSKNIEEVVEEIKELKVCNSCGKELPEDSEFCQYCGSQDISIVKKELENIIKKCSVCGKEIPSDSKFCQYCGSDFDSFKGEEGVAEIHQEKITNEIKPIYFTTNQNVETNGLEKGIMDKQYKNPFIIACIAACIAIVGLVGAYFFFNNKISSYEAEIMSNVEKISSLTSKNKELSSNVDKYRTKANKYDNLVSAVNKITSYSDLYANKYILYKPNNERVYVTLNTGERIWYSTTQNVDAEWSDYWNGYQISIYITYSGSGVETVKIYPEGRESHAIFIVVFG